MCDPSGSTSTPTGVVCGDPSGMSVAMTASCFSCRSCTPPGDSLSARGIYTPYRGGWLLPLLPLVLAFVFAVYLPAVTASVCRFVNSMAIAARRWGVRFQPDDRHIRIATYH